MIDFGWAFLTACVSLGISLGVACSYSPFHVPVYEMGHDVYILKGNKLRGCLRRGDNRRIGAFVFSSFCAALSVILTIIFAAKIVQSIQ